MYKKLGVFLLTCTFLMSFIQITSASAIDAVTSNAQNPFIWADVPDNDVIRVGDAYYMSSTTMHMNPGVPIMKSYDLVNWEIVSYVYDILADNDEQTLSNGKNDYGRGSWASSLRYNNGKFYVSFDSNTTGKTYIYQTTNIEKGPWTHATLDGVYHDNSLLFDDDGRVYMISGSNDIKAIELNSDATAIKEGGLNKVIIPNASQIVGSDIIVRAEGSHIQKINGKYYIFLITWPQGSGRTELCYRADSIDGNYEGKVALEDSGIAQGGIVDTVDKKWYGMLFQDHGSVGRIPYLVPVTWQNEWPVFGVDGVVPQDTGIPTLKSKIVASDDFNQISERVGALSDSASTVTQNAENSYNGSNLALVWQWNHNPDNSKWSLTERPGYLRLTTGRTSKNILDARNTLTQRTFGPECSGNIAMDISNMKDGDYAGLAAFQKQYGFAGVKMSGTSKSIVMVDGSSEVEQEVANIPITQDKVYFKIDFDYNDRTDQAYFYYSLDGTTWTAIGDALQMSYTMPHFMGYRFALFNYATKATGGFVDFDYFKVDNKITPQAN